MPVVIVVFFGLFGLCIGSFLNVLIARLPLGQSIITGPSSCMRCRKPIRKYDLIPVLSYLILGGKCRDCGEKIGIRYPLVELLTGILFALLALLHPVLLEAALYALAGAALIAAGWIDFEHRIIPNGIVLFLLIDGAALTLFAADLPWLERIIGLFCVSVPLLVIGLVAPGAMGMGDVKLMAAGGLILGWKLVLFSFLLGAVAAAVFGLRGQQKEQTGDQGYDSLRAVSVGRHDSGAADWQGGNGMVFWIVLTGDGRKSAHFAIGRSPELAPIQLYSQGRKRHHAKRSAGNPQSGPLLPEAERGRVVLRFCSGRGSEAGPRDHVRQAEVGRTRAALPPAWHDAEAGLSVVEGPGCDLPAEQQ
jgi:leader peptidase (prepilin peptidase)/N-methyltransferase